MSPQIGRAGCWPEKAIVRRRDSDDGQDSRLRACESLVLVLREAASWRAVVVTLKHKIVAEDKPLAGGNRTWHFRSKRLMTRTRIWMVGIFQYPTDPLHPAIPAAGVGSAGDSS